MALQGLDLTVKQGELVGVVGASGSGKTTLMNVLGGLTRPSAGQVIIDGKNLLKLSTRELTAYRQVEVGFVWQQGSRNLIPYLSALDNIKLPMTLAGGAGSQIDKRARELMDLVDLSHRYDTNRFSSPAANSSASPSPSPWPTSQNCCWLMNRPASSTPRPPIRFTTSSSGSTATWG